MQVGAPADALYFIQSGEVVVTGTNKQEITRYQTGQSFGESCLEGREENATRKANIVAIGPCTLLKLTAKVFKEQLGNLQELTAINFKRKLVEGIIIDEVKLVDSLSVAETDELITLLIEVSYTSGAKILDAKKKVWQQHQPSGQAAKPSKPQALTPTHPSPPLPFCRATLSMSSNPAKPTSCRIAQAPVQQRAQSGS